MKRNRDLGQGLGPSGHCVCVKCDYQTLHQAGTPCQDMRCPHCGAKLMREGSQHHELATRHRPKQD